MYIGRDLSPNFQLAFGYTHSANEPELSCTKVACKFTDGDGMIVKLAGDSRGQIVVNLGKEMSRFSLPLTLILVAKCNCSRNTASPKYQLGLGLEA